MSCAHCQRYDCGGCDPGAPCATCNQVSTDLDHAGDCPACRGCEDEDDAEIARGSYFTPWIAGHAGGVR